MTTSRDKRRLMRVRKKIKSVNYDRYRLTVYRSTKNISVQIIDDNTSKTLVSASSLEKELKEKFTKENKKKKSNIVGEILAKRALEKKIKNVVFDRGKYRYHGRVKELADSLRKNGLNL